MENCAVFVLILIVIITTLKDYSFNISVKWLNNIYSPNLYMMVVIQLQPSLHGVHWQPTDKQHVTWLTISVMIGSIALG